MKLRKKGFTLIELMIVIAIIAIIAAIAIPNLIEARKHGNEAAAIGALKTITNSQSMFREGDKEGDSNEDYGTLTELSDQQLIDDILGGGTKQGYTFQATYGAATSEYIWYAVGNPAVVGTTGDRYFATNHEGVTFYTTADIFSLNSSDCQIPNGAQPVGK